MDRTRSGTVDCLFVSLFVVIIIFNLPMLIQGWEKQEKIFGHQPRSAIGILFLYDLVNLNAGQWVHC